jgi:hexosaminidase
MRAHALVPAPLSVQLSPGAPFVVDSTTAVVFAAESASDAGAVAQYLFDLLGLPPTTRPRQLAAGEAPPAKSIALTLDPRRDTLGDEGYELAVAAEGITLASRTPAGLFYGVQTLRQLLPVSVEHTAAVGRVLTVPAGRIADAPRFAWRGAMLDVARHFLGVEDVKRYLDLMALYKLNRLHLHLSDDQGWRIEIRSRPNLTTIGGRTAVGGGPGGYYTQAQFADLVAYAGQRFITIVPEIDMPGHTNAALASYPELNCDGVAPPLYTGIRVGFSTLCVDRETTYAFVDDVVREIGGLVPTPYFHIGGDEVERLTAAQYRSFVERVEGIVRARGKTVIGWGEIAPAKLAPSTIVQHWHTDSAQLHVARGGRVILSPAKLMYLDMKYDSTTTLGLKWAGYVEVRDAYALDPATYLPGVPESAILGVEAPLWSETLVKIEDFEFMAFPRLAAIAEVGWSPASARDWEAFRQRLARQGPRLTALGVNFYRSPQVAW